MLPVVAIKSSKIGSFPSFKRKIKRASLPSGKSVAEAKAVKNRLMYAKA